MTRHTESLLGFTLPSELVEAVAHRMTVRCRGVEVELKGRDCISKLTSRSSLDRFLADKAVSAGAELVEEAAVESVKVSDAGVTAKTRQGEFSGRMLVGADGAAGNVAGYVRGPLRACEMFVAVEADVPGESAGVDRLEVDFGVAPRGYGWVFPKRDGFSVGVGGLAPLFKDPVRVFRGYLKSRGFPPDVVCRSHVVPVGGFRRKTCGDGIVLCGDAAGFADPLTGEGISYAVYSGRLAGEFAVKAHDTGDFTAKTLGAYGRRCESEFGGHLRSARLLSRIVHSFPWFFTKLAAGNPEVGECFLDVVAGECPYGRFNRRMALSTPYFTFRGLFKALSSKWLR